MTMDLNNNTFGEVLFPDDDEIFNLDELADLSQVSSLCDLSNLKELETTINTAQFSSLVQENDFSSVQLIDQCNLADEVEGTAIVLTPGPSGGNFQAKYEKSMLGDAEVIDPEHAQLYECFMSMIPSAPGYDNQNSVAVVEINSPEISIQTTVEAVGEEVSVITDPLMEDSQLTNSQVYNTSGSETGSPAKSFSPRRESMRIKKRKFKQAPRNVEDSNVGTSESSSEEGDSQRSVDEQQGMETKDSAAEGQKKEKRKKKVKWHELELKEDDVNYEKCKRAKKAHENRERQKQEYETMKETAMKVPGLEEENNKLREELKQAEIKMKEQADSIAKLEDENRQKTEENAGLVGKIKDLEKVELENIRLQNQIKLQQINGGNIPAPLEKCLQQLWSTYEKLAPQHGHLQLQDMPGKSVHENSEDA